MTIPCKFWSKQYEPRPPMYSSQLSNAYPWYLHRLGITGMGSAQSRDNAWTTMHTLPGLKRLCGSKVFLMVFISFTVPSPSSSTRYSFFPMPTPCSPVPTDHKLTGFFQEGRGGCTYTFRQERLLVSPSDAQLDVPVPAPLLS